MILTTNGEPITFKELNEQAERLSGGIEWGEVRSSEGDDPTAKNVLLALAGLTEAETKGDAE